MTPIICIVGRSKAGKTTIIERLIPELVRRGFEVGAIKHTHKPFEMDHQGTDTTRLKTAGAREVVISSPHRVGLVGDVSRDLSLDELAARYVHNMDLIIAEGFKTDRHPKIEVYRSTGHEAPLAPDLDNLIAVMSDVPLSLKCPCLSLDDVVGLADLVETRIMRIQEETDVTLWVNGRLVPLSIFPELFIASTLKGMVSSLRDCESPEDIEVRIQPHKRRLA